MTNGAFLLIFALAGLVIAWLEISREGEKPNRDWIREVVGLLGLAAIVLGARQFLGMSDWPVGALVGCGLALAVNVWNNRTTMGFIGLGALAGQVVETESVVSAAPVGSHFVALALIGFVGAIVAWGGNARGGTAFAGVGALVLLANRWTPDGFGKLPNSVGSMLALAAVAAALIVVALSRSKQGPKGMLAGGLGCVLLAAAGFFVAQWGGDDMTLPVTIFVSVLGAFAVAWMDDGKVVTQRRSTQLILGGLIFMGLATFAFAQDQSFGVAVSALVGLAAFVFLGRADLVGVVGPVFGLLGYRTLRIDFPDVTRSFDIAQHYGMVGVMVGVGLLVLLMGVNRVPGGAKNWGRFAVVALIAALAAVVGLFFFGVKGGVGLIVGLGIGSWLAALISPKSAFGMAPLVGLVGLVGASYGEVSQAFEITRDEKMQIFIWSAIGLAALVVVLNLFLTEKPLGEVSDAA